ANYAPPENRQSWFSLRSHEKSSLFSMPSAAKMRPSHANQYTVARSRATRASGMTAKPFEGISYRRGSSRTVRRVEIVIASDADFF
ncbi:hypothetical protein, partial [Methylocystis sp.]|uniref:hypothetical protein n=1 Tax=Methylocystis sp. TaxID=1911079 RepID=UPI00273582D9